MAASSDPDARCGSRVAEVPSPMTRRTLGWARPMPSSRSGASQRAVVPIMPMRAVPDHLVAQGGDVGDGGFELGGDPAAPFDDGLALFGQLAALAVDQLHPQLPLEAGHVAGDVGLHGVQGRGRRREAAVVGDGDQGLQLPEVHRHHRYHTFGKTAGQIAELGGRIAGQPWPSVRGSGSAAESASVPWHGRSRGDLRPRPDPPAHLQHAGAQPGALRAGRGRVVRRCPARRS